MLLNAATYIHLEGPFPFLQCFSILLSAYYVQRLLRILDNMDRDNASIPTHGQWYPHRPYI